MQTAQRTVRPNLALDPLHEPGELTNRYPTIVTAPLNFGYESIVNRLFSEITLFLWFGFVISTPKSNKNISLQLLFHLPALMSLKQIHACMSIRPKEIRSYPLWRNNQAPNHEGALKLGLRLMSKSLFTKPNHMSSHWSPSITPISCGYECNEMQVLCSTIWRSRLSRSISTASFWNR